MAQTRHLGARAIVVGGGMAGLFSARVLSDHFDEVIVLDRDDEPTTNEPRGTVPQGHHFHVLLPGGLDAMTDWFPGFVDDLVDTGSVEMQLGRDFYAYTSRGRSYSMQAHVPDPIDGGEVTYVQTRPQLESTVRRRVASLANVSLRHRALVDGPITADDRVVGVVVRNAGPITADFVVDASGRNSCSARWLPDLGFDVAPETYVNCDVSYASVICQPVDWDAFEGTVVFVMPSGDGIHASRMGSVVKLPHDKWLVMLGGRYGDNPPTEWEEFRGFGSTLIASIWDDLVDTVTQVSAIKSYRMPRAVRHHYEQLARFPDGLLPIGDSVCFFNPTHGQGMSSAAGQVRGLQTLLDGRATDGRGIDGLAMEFFPIAEDWVRGPWILAATGDFAHPDCTGDFPEADLPDLMLFAEAAEAGATSSETLRLVNDIATLRKPLSAIRAVTPA
jgi:flavin-dependent dehydrogenase